MASLHRRFADRVDFAFVYVAEAHASDEWPLEDNVAAGIALTQPTTLDARLRQARETAERLRLALPLYVDTLTNDASRAFAAWPERLVVVAADRKLVDVGAPGPWGFSPESAEAALVRLLG